jgi:hypothetical protein
MSKLFWPAVAAMKAGVFGGGIGAAHLMKKKDERDAEQNDKNQREADAEMKRESRGVKKPANFGVLEEAQQEVKDTQDREKIKSMGYKNGGYVRAADGIAKRGKTRGKMV